MKTRVKYMTLGCKVNQYETQAMREQLECTGAESLPFKADSGAEFVVINTCTVTAEADKENRYWIRRARRENPNARIIVTGCAVERNRSEIALLPEVDLILSNQDKNEIASVLIPGCARPEIQEEGNPKHRYMPLQISRTEGGGRAFVKIQDGCNHACSFCKVVMVRGRSRSRPISDILGEIVRLRDSGYREIVFAGIQLGAFGLDYETSGDSALVEILERASLIEGIERLRLSSIEPTDLKPVLIDALASIPKCAPQLHIPLQSGDDFILKKMNRRYSRDFYIELIDRLRQSIPDFMLTLDVMAGFPGETEHHFLNTLDVLRRVQPLKCHVFPYSKRDGTRAERFAEEVPDVIVRHRVKELMQCGELAGQALRSGYLGKVMPVLVENWGEDGLLHGLTPNYLKVCFEGCPEQIGQIIPAELVFLGGDTFLGKPFFEK